MEDVKAFKISLVFLLALTTSANADLLTSGDCLTWDIEQGLSGFTVDNDFGDGSGLWHVTTSCMSGLAGHTTPTSLHYGLDAQCNYDAGQTEGVVTSPVISLLPTSGLTTLSFKYYLETEGAPTIYDQAIVEVSQNSGPFNLLCSSADGCLTDPSGNWQLVVLDLSPMAGSDIRIRFRFRTVDSVLNSYQGFYVDDIEICGGECTTPPDPFNPDPPDGAGEVPVDTELAWNVVVPLPCDLTNGGFEDGGFAPWTNITGPGSELTSWNVTNGGTGWFSDGFPFEGSLFAQNGFDGDDGLFYDIYQEITIPADATSAILNWSERIQWDMLSFSGSTLPREYAVTVQPAGGGTPLALLHSMDLNPGTSGDTGYVPHSVDLLAVAPGIAGQTVRINFHETIPESYTGPAQFDLDGVSLICDGTVAPSTSATSPPVNTIDFAALEAQYNLLRQEALALRNAVPEVRTGYESGTGKDDSTPASGTPVDVLNVGGPDCGGYSFIDSHAPGGPSFSAWIEISGTGTNLGLWDDSYYYPINLPFSFDFYGTLRNQVAVGSNGTVHFVDSYMQYMNQCIPAAASGIDSFIALYWDDLYPSGSNNVYYQIVGSAPNRILVVQWQGVRHFGGSSTNGVTAQVQLFESSNNIMLLYANASSEAGAGGTVGIQRDPSCGLVYSCNQPSLSSSLAVLFSRDSCFTANVTYDLYFGTDPSNMELVCDDICETNCDPIPETGLLDQPCVTYYWQVMAENQCGVTEGNIWSFTTEGVCNQPPDCSAALPSIPKIWPPNHKWVDIEILGVTDPDGDPVSIAITGITQDETIDGNGSGHTVLDGGGVGGSVARVRAERSGLGNGRVYEIAFEADDGMDGVCSGNVKVCVPHDHNPQNVCIDDGQLYDSTAAELLQADLNGDGTVNQLDFAILVEHWLKSYELDN